MTIGRDLRYAIRVLRLSPAFTVPAVASLALGIAINTTTFSIFNAVLLRPLGAAGGGDLVRIGRSLGGDGTFRSASREELVYLREHASSLADVLGHQLESVTMATPDGTEVVSAEIVTGNYFSGLGVQPPAGRGFSLEEDRAAGDAPVAVIGHRYWRRRFSADPRTVGTTVLVNNHPMTIVGVAPEGFAGTFPGVDIDVWIPAMMASTIANRPNQGAPALLLIGRLKPGVSIATARAEVQVLARRMIEETPGRDRDRGFVLASARGAHPLLTRIAGTFLLLLMAVVAVVLLVACANVASLLLARAGARQGEVAVRLALGASRGRVAALLLVESAVLALLGGAAGLLLAFWATRFLNAFTLATGPTGTPIFFDLQLDVRVLLFTAAVSIATTLVFGLLPALRATKVDLVSGLKDPQSAGGRKRSRLRATLVIVQVALSFALLVAGGLLFRSLRNVGQLDLGFDPDRVAVASFDLQSLGYERQRVEAFYDELLRRARTFSEVERAALAELVPMGGRGRTVALAIRDTTLPAGQDTVTVPFNRVSDDYFATVQQDMVRGRSFTAREASEGQLVCIVNETMARRFWPGDDPLGKRVKLDAETNDREVVGVARDATYASFDSDIGPFLFLPVRQAYQPRLTLHVRTSRDPADAVERVRRLVREIDPNVGVSDAGAMRGQMALALVPMRIAQGVFGVAGTIALLLASGGLYGLVCYTLAQRTKEIGVRIALGATRGAVFRLIVAGAVRLAAVGVAIGIAIAAAATHLFSTFLYGLSPTDPVTFAGTAALLMLVTLGAGYGAARRGLNVDPTVLLRHQ